MTQHSGRDDIGIIGYAAQLPGAASIADMWDVLLRKHCCVTDIPATRWGRIRFHDTDPAMPGKTYVTRAGLLADPFMFDAAHFGISPREALQMDPQQRLLLETVAQAFDHAGIDPTTLDKHRTGVFIGASAADHSTAGLADPSVVEAHFMHGNTLSILANRISYTWDLRGPSFTIDTACSSGLYALDQACKSIALGEIDTAIVGAVNLLLSPIPFVGFSKAAMLSPSGLCRAFAAGADGYVRSEGAVVFVLRRASLAERNGDRVRSVIVGTVTNTDGRTSGMALPSGERQAELLAKALNSFVHDPNDLAYVEAHGTGTPVGDPIEARALGSVYGQPRATALPIGSVKTNFGHLEPASGLVGLLKVQLALEERVIPASLHAEMLNPAIDFADLNLDLVRFARPLPHRAHPWLMAVNSFGFGGANAHVVVRSGATGTSRRAAATPRLPAALLLSGSSSDAVPALAKAWQVRLATPGTETKIAASIAMSNHRLTRHRHRAVIVADGAEDLARQLGSLVERATDAVAAARAPQKVGFVYAGNGAQWAGMGTHLYHQDITFRDMFHNVSDLFQAGGGGDLVALLHAPDLARRLVRSPVSQPLIFALQVALTEALAAWGLRPDATLGHSLGEVAAAWAAGKIDLATAAKVIRCRAERLDVLYDKGAMAALATGADEAAALIADLGGRSVEIAADNARDSVTLAGPRPDLELLLRAARARRIAGKLLKINYPYHSSALDPLRDSLLADLADVGGTASQIPFLSSARAAPVDGGSLNAEFWWQNAREPVQFRQAFDALIDEGVGVCVEIGPRPMLVGNMRETLAGRTGATQTVALLSSLEDGRGARRDARRIAADALAANAQMDEAPLLGAPGPTPAGAFSGTPPYPFSRQRYEIVLNGTDVYGRKAWHPLLGSRSAEDGACWTGSLSLGRLPWLADHRLHGQAILPATAILEMMLAAGRELLAGPTVEITDVDILRPVRLDPGSAIATRLTHDAASRRLTLEARELAAWVTVAVARLAPGPAEIPSLPAIAPGPAAASPEISAMYQHLAAVGLEYGPAFARLLRLDTDGHSAAVALAPAELGGPFLIDPALVDTALHGIVGLLNGAGATDGFAAALVPTRIDRVRFYGSAAITGAHLVLTAATLDGVAVDVHYLDADGRAVLAFEALRLRPFARPADRARLFWDECPVPVDGAAAKDCGLIPALADGAPDPASPVAELRVIRDALAGRLAWDVLATTPDPAGDLRASSAAMALVEMGLAEPSATGPVQLTGACPWPETDQLVSLFARSCPDASGEMRVVLDTVAAPVTGAADPAARDPVPATGRTLYAVVAGLTLNRETAVLVAGKVDRALIDALAARAGRVVILTAGSDAAERQRLLLDGVNGILVIEPDQLGTVGRFDLVLGLNLTRDFPVAEVVRLADVAMDDAGLLLVEETPDLFAVMTGLQDHPRKINRLTDAFDRRGIALTAHAWRGADGVLMLHGQVAGTTAGDPVDGITLLPPVVTGAADQALSDARTLRDLAPVTAPRWIGTTNPDHGASLRGWLRGLRNETGDDLRSVAFLPAAQAGDGAACDAALRRLIRAGVETDLICGDAGRVFAPRVRPVDLGSARPAGDGPLRQVLTRARGAGIDGLSWTLAPRRPPAAGEVEIEVTATGLNFRDVMLIEGMLPPEAMEGGFAGPHAGMECAGCILRVGAGVDFAPGDRVVAFASDAFASHVTVSARTVMALPAGLDATLAAAMPVAFLTADHALNGLARLGSGDWLLLTGAAGGVGQAALQIARQSGARVIALAGTAAKRRFLQAMGAAHVIDSRDADFADQVMALTGGRGVDVVLNSVAGLPMERALACLAPFGRFLELGKRDFFANSVLGMRPLRNNIAYFAIDADQLIKHRPDLATRSLQRVLAGFATRQLHLPTVEMFEAPQIGEAVRQMKRPNHMGKILIRPPAVPAVTDHARPISGTWLVVGGTRGFGLETARWLARAGATDLWLVSRSGAIDPAVLAEFAARNVNVTVRAADLTRPDAAEDLFRDLSVSLNGQPLGGVVHAAMVLQDGLFAQQTDAQRTSVLAAKLTVAAWLDALSRPLSPRHFWLYASVAGRFGNRGQTAYAAANLGLEALAVARHRAGLPALAIAWGPIADVGTLAGQAALRHAIEARFGKLLTAGAALDALQQVVERDPDRATITIAPIDWHLLLADHPVLAGPLTEELDLKLQQGKRHAAVDLAALLAGSDPAAAYGAVLDILVDVAADIMRAVVADVDPRRPLVDLGFDSLMGMSFKIAVEERLGVALPVMAMGEGISLGDIATQLIAAARDGAAHHDAIDALAARHLDRAGDVETLGEHIRRTVAAE